MRRLIALAVLVTAATISASFSSSARAEGSAMIQPKDWITLHSAPAVTQVDHHTWTKSNHEPVLLPLPAEGWVGLVMVLSIVVYCGVRRARFLAIR